MHKKGVDFVTDTNQFAYQIFSHFKNKLGLKLFFRTFNKVKSIILGWSQLIFCPQKTWTNDVIIHSFSSLLGSTQCCFLGFLSHFSGNTFKNFWCIFFLKLFCWLFVNVSSVFGSFSGFTQCWFV